jgi:hypothetical protein
MSNLFWPTDAQIARLHTRAQNPLAQATQATKPLCSRSALTWPDCHAIEPMSLDLAA